MLVAVDTLQNIAIIELVRWKYKNSTLPGFVSKNAFVARNFTYEAYSYRNSIFPIHPSVLRNRFRNYIDPLSKYKDKFLQTRDGICEDWIIPETYLKKRIILCFKTITLEIFNYAKKLVKSLKQYHFRVRFCVDRICVNQAGRIDKAQTILRILKDSQFLIEFHHETLYQNMVMNSDIIRVSEEVLDSIKNYPDPNKVAKIEAAIGDMLKLYFMDMIYIAEKFVTDGLTDHVRTAVYSLYRTKNYEGLRKLCDLMNLDNRRKLLNDENTKRWFALRMSRLDGEMIQYLFFNLTSEDWNVALKMSFDYYIQVLIYDWRCGEMAVSVFNYALDAGFINVNNIVFIFTLGHMMNIENEDYDQFAEEYDTLCWIDVNIADTCIEVLKVIWNDTPMSLRNDFKEYILQSDDVRHINAESLMSIVDTYSVDDQGRIISKLMDDINNRGFSDYQSSHYNKLFNMYLSLKAKSNNQIVVNDDILTKFRSCCDI